MSNAFHTNSIISLTNGFWRTRYTLTKVIFEFYEHGAPITITDILFYLPNLKTLRFNVTDSLADVLGELEALQKPHRFLTDLSLRTSSTSGDALKPLTKWCPYVQRLRLLEATPSALDVVIDYFPNVEILGYDNSLELPASHDILNQDYNNKEPIIPVINMDNMYTKQHQGRLRAFYSSNGGWGVPGDTFLRLLQKNQKTLEILHANMGSTEQQKDDDEPFDNFRPGYAMKADNMVLNMDRLKRLKYWPDIYGAYEQLFCRIVAPSLTYFESVETFDLSAVVDTLINSQPHLETLAFSSVYMRGLDEEDIVDTQSWVRLFNEYPNISLSRPDPARTLRNVMFDHCHNFSDDALNALANIKTIKCLGFKGYSRITCQGFKNFFIKLNKHNVQITKFILGTIEDPRGSDPVPDRDALFGIISGMKELEELYLYDLNWLLHEDVEELVYTAKKLNTLAVSCRYIACTSVISSVYRTGRKIKYVETIDEFDIFD
ncbi:hypothetical protein BDC45DRAFT_26048 [Circinella umbellata]|nr:hypothetical protein BDC45DRAFT_26048 [Circinella umbellata]